MAELEHMDKETLVNVLYDVPNEMVGRIIGREGATVRVLQSLSGANLEIPPETEPGQSIRRIKLTGKVCNILYCKAMMETKIAHGEDSNIPLPQGDQVQSCVDRAVECLGGHQRHANRQTEIILSVFP
jgi:hypothetical protein